MEVEDYYWRMVEGGKWRVGMLCPILTAGCHTLIILQLYVQYPVSSIMEWKLLYQKPGTNERQAVTKEQRKSRASAVKEGGYVYRL